MTQIEVNNDQKTAIEQIMNEVRLKRATQSMAAGEATMRLGNLSAQQAVAKPVGVAEIVLPTHAYLQKFDPLLQSVFDGNKPLPPPPPTPSTLGPFSTGYVTFDNGVPVGGSASLTLHSDGTYDFNGNFHDSGAPSYDLQFAWVIVGASGTAYAFSHSGHMAGTFENGSRDDLWTNSGQNKSISEGWTDLVKGYTWRWQVYVNWDVQAAIDAIVSALKAAGTIIAAVVAIVAAL